jgi:hypothetical protein
MIRSDMAKYDDWPDKTQAAGRIGISVKTLERMADRGEVEQRMRPREGASPQAVFNPKDVEREASKRAAVNGKPFILPGIQSEPEPAPEQPQSGLELPIKLPANFVGLFEAMLERLVPKLLPPPAQEPSHLLTVEEVLMLGYTRDWIRKQRKLGMLTPFGRKYSRFELERLAGRD